MTLKQRFPGTDSNVDFCRSWLCVPTEKFYLRLCCWVFQGTFLVMMFFWRTARGGFVMTGFTHISRKQPLPLRSAQRGPVDVGPVLMDTRGVLPRWSTITHLSLSAGPGCENTSSCGPNLLLSLEETPTPELLGARRGYFCLHRVQSCSLLRVKSSFDVLSSTHNMLLTSWKCCISRRGVIWTLTFIKAATCYRCCLSPTAGEQEPKWCLNSKL